MKLVFGIAASFLSLSACNPSATQPTSVQVAASAPTNAPSTEAIGAATRESAAAVASAPISPPEESWSYSETEDKMDGGKTVKATVVSSNSAELSPPYENTYAVLAVRHSKADGLNVIFAVLDGQIVCGMSDDCALTVRFDDAQPIRFKASLPSDNSSKVLFIRNEKNFVLQASKASRIRVQVTMYQAGTKVFEFDTKPFLKWPPKKL